MSDLTAMHIVFGWLVVLIWVQILSVGHLSDARGKINLSNKEINNGDWLHILAQNISCFVL